MLVARGARVLIADLDGARATAATEGFPAGSVAAAEVDVSAAASVAGMIERAVGIWGGIDGLFNNAGIMPAEDGDATETDEAVWDRVVAVNMKSVYLCCRFAIPAMLASGGGAIVNNASIVAALGSWPSQIAYTASKGGVIAMTRELGVAWARRGIRVNAILPGITRTAMVDRLQSTQDGEAHGRRLDHIPAGRYAEPEEIGETVAFLLSDRASYITAQNWPVDGGMTGAYLCPPFPDGGDGRT